MSRPIIINNQEELLQKADQASQKRKSEPNWQNDITRLNASNMNTMRKNMLDYTDNLAKTIITDETEKLNIIMNNSAGKIYPGTDQTGEIFNDYSDRDEQYRTYDSIKDLSDSQLTELKGNVAAGTYSHSEGYGNSVFKNTGHAEGQFNIVSGVEGHAEGLFTKSLGSQDHAEGRSTIASGGYGAHAEGYLNKALGPQSHAEGSETVAGISSGMSSGTNNGKGAHSEGYKTQALLNYTHAEGSQTVAGDAENKKGTGAHAEGYKSKALANYAHSEGYATIASEEASHAEGYQTQASGKYSHAAGDRSKAPGKFSHAGGICSITAYDEDEANYVKGQYVIGRYNKVNKKALFIVGNGTGQADAKRKNAFEVLDTGAATLQTQGTTDNSLVINKTLNDKIAIINQDITNIKTNISNALHFRGVFESIEDAESKLTNIIDGDVIVVTKDSTGDNNTSNEYVYSDGSWEKLGDANDFLLKTQADEFVLKDTTIAGLKLDHNITDTELRTALNITGDGSGDIPDLANYVPTSRTIAGINLTTDISKEALRTALDIGDGSGSVGIIDNVLSLTSTNPVENRVITESINNIQSTIGDFPGNITLADSISDIYEIISKTNAITIPYDNLWLAIQYIYDEQVDAGKAIQNKMGILGVITNDMDGEPLTVIPTGLESVTLEFNSPAYLCNILTNPDDTSCAANVDYVNNYVDNALADLPEADLPEYQTAITWGSGAPDSSTPGNIYIRIG